MIHVGDCREVMAALDSAVYDAIVCDPPYGLEFMGSDWDAPWKRGFTPSGMKDGARKPAPVFGSMRNPMCRSCRKHKRGTDCCRCESPDFDERPADEARLFQAWCDTWAVEAYRVLKPGGFILAFGGTRTYHRLACALEDAGFELRDSIHWLYGSGFPKSLDVAKAIDKHLGQEGSYGGVRAGHEGFTERTDDFAAGGRAAGWKRPWQDDDEARARHHLKYEPATEPAIAAQGWGTALKPAHEPIVVGRKPLRGTVAANVLEYGTGAINIGASRLGTNAGWSYPNGRGGQGWHGRETLGTNLDVPMEATDGRWPANVVLSHTVDCEMVGEREVESDGHFPAARPQGWAGLKGHHGQEALEERVTKGEVVEVWECVEGCPVAILDAQSGQLKAGGNLRGNEPSSPFGGAVYGEMVRDARAWQGYGDKGGASRFFYCAKVTRAERDAGLGDEFEVKPLNWSSGDANPGSFQAEGTEKEARNNHPTVKPIDLMRWLLTLVTPAGGKVLDPFAGSGSTLCAGAVAGIEVVGIEQDAEFARIAEARAAFWKEHGPEGFQVCRAIDSGRRQRQKRERAGQLDLLAG